LSRKSCRGVDIDAAAMNFNHKIGAEERLHEKEIK